MADEQLDRILRALALRELQLDAESEAAPVPAELRDRILREARRRGLLRERRYSGEE